MPEDKNKAEEFNRSQEGSSHGPQGIDKAPGEETSTDFENVVQDTQKAKNKVDGDPSKPEDQPKDE
jgi:hypothetical protein